MQQRSRKKLLFPVSDSEKVTEKTVACIEVYRGSPSTTGKMQHVIAGFVSIGVIILGLKLLDEF